MEKETIYGTTAIENEETGNWPSGEELAAIAYQNYLNYKQTIIPGVASARLKAAEVKEEEPKINAMEAARQKALDCLFKPGTDVIIRAGMLDLRHGYTWMKEAHKDPVPRMLFGEFWHEGEVSILFADSNVGKSILAVQVADSISRGTAIPGFKLECEKQPVLYFDFELSKNRYSINYEEGYDFDPNFIRVEINPAVTVPRRLSFEEYLAGSITQAVQVSGAKVLVIDNITYLRDEQGKARKGQPLMRELKTLKNTYGLSVLVLAHTAKRNAGKALTRSDLQGSRLLMNLCDSAFCIGESTQGSDLRYIKQVKNRNTGTIYSKNNVCVCRLTKPGNFLGFELTGYSNEADHLAEQLSPEQQYLGEKIQSLAKEGQTHRQVAAQLHISLSTVGKYLKKEKITGNSSNVSNNGNTGNSGNMGNSSNDSNMSNSSNMSNAGNSGNNSNMSNAGNSSNVSNDSNMGNSGNNSNMSNGDNTLLN